MTASVGIDFGTSNCSVTAWGDDDRVVALGADRPLEWNFPGADLIFPSVFTQVEERRLFGWAAKTHRGARLEAVKRLLKGNEHMDLGSRTFSSRHVAGLLFGALRARCDDEGFPFDEAVVTIPANSTGQARFRTRQAAKMAGIRVKALINEPTAAGMAYLADFPDVETLLVYDWGGGTIDATVLQVRHGVFEELASRGIAGLGGLEVDRRLRELIFQSLPEAQLYKGADKVQFELDVERAKIRLSSAVDPDEEVPFSSPDGAHTFSVTRKAFEDAIAFLVQNTMEPVERCLSESGLEAVDIDAVLLVGGSSQIPLVRKRVQALLNTEAVSAELFDPMTAVSRGAAVTAAAMDGKLDVAPSVISSHALGTRTEVDGQRRFSELIPRGVPLPVRASKHYTPTEDFQRTLKIDVWEGDKDLPLDDPENVRLTNFTYVISEPKPRSETSFELEYEYDLDGILHITLRDSKSHKVLVDDEQDFFDELEDIDPEISDIEGTFAPLDERSQSALPAPSSSRRRTTFDPTRTQQIIVVDGSNVACHGLQVSSGKDKPSYAQLKAALDALGASFRDARVLVVVDANLVHKVDASEKPELQRDIAEGRVLVPSAGTDGGGDALVLAIAHMRTGLVVSNDSFQPFQQTYPWIREGRVYGAVRVDGDWLFQLRTPPRPRSAITTGAPSPETIAARSRAIVAPQQRLAATAATNAALPVGWENSHWWSGE